MCKFRLAAILIAAALMPAPPAALCAQSTAKPKPHAKAATKTNAAKRKKPTPAVSAADDSANVNSATADRVHAWVAQQQQEQAATTAANPKGIAEETPKSSATPKSTAKTASRPTTAKSAGDPEAPIKAAPEASTKAAETSTKATAADFDKAVEERNAAASKKTEKPAKPSPAKPSPATPATKPTVPPQAKLTYRHGHLVMPAPLFGSHEILVHQNQVADTEGLDRIRDSDDLDAMREKRLLVSIPTGNGMRVDPRLSEDRRYTRPWTAKFLSDIARAHAAKFHSVLQVNSAVRTVDFQARLIAYNGNAAPIEGADASPHLTGQAVDLAKHGLSSTEIAWMRAYLAPLIAEGKIDVEEEFQQACFHISVYRSYAPAPIVRNRTLKRQIAEDTHKPMAAHASAALAVAVQ